MEPISSKDFLEKLNSGNLKSEVHLFGKAKKSDKESEMLFAFKSKKELHWIRIPGSMIDHAHLLKSFTIEGEPVSLVKLRLKEPKDAEAMVLYKLLGELSEKMMMIWKKKMMMDMDSGMHWGGWKGMKKGGCGCGSSHHWHHEDPCGSKG
jgi:hypothetical protein